MRIEGVTEQLEASEARKALLEHRFFRNCEHAPLNRAIVAQFLGQYWHPIHYFPDFLSRTIAAVPSLGARTAVSKILYQELGEGVLRRAHEELYIFTMTRCGFDRDALVGTAPNRATARLMEGYRESTRDGWSALGFLFGTEAADLTLVQALGHAVRRSSQATGPLPWVEIHVVQEPDHTAMAGEAVLLTPNAQERERLVKAANEAWARWSDFFTALDDLIVPAAEAVA